MIRRTHYSYPGELNGFTGEILISETDTGWLVEWRSGSLADSKPFDVSDLTGTAEDVAARRAALLPDAEAFADSLESELVDRTTADATRKTALKEALDTAKRGS